MIFITYNLGNPYKDSNIPGSSTPYKTLFVSNLVIKIFNYIYQSYKTDEKKLKKEFEIFGPIRFIRVVVDQKTGKSRGYAFIEYDREKDM